MRTRSGIASLSHLATPSMLTQAHVVGSAIYQLTKDVNGNAVCTKISAQDYANLSTFGANPVSGIVYSKDILDTPSGDLDDGYFLEAANGTVKVKLPNCYAVSVKSTDIVNGVLDPAVESAIVDSFANSQAQILLEASADSARRSLEIAAADSAVTFL